MSTVQSLRASDEDFERTLPNILSTSNAIFPPDGMHESLALWRERLTPPSSVVLYIAHPDATPESPHAVAFICAYPRTHSPSLRTGETETMHIWLAGVLPDWRRKGFLEQLIDKLAESTVGRVTVCTSPTRFPNMWSFLTKRGWEVEREFPDGKIMLSKILRE